MSILYTCIYNVMFVTPEYFRRRFVTQNSCFTTLVVCLMSHVDGESAERQVLATVEQKKCISSAVVLVPFSLLRVGVGF